MSRRLDSGDEDVLSAIDELKWEMRDITDLALCELKTRRFVDNAGHLYELVGALMLPNTKLVESRGWTTVGVMGDRSPTKFEIPEKSPTIFAMVTHKHPHQNLWYML